MQIAAVTRRTIRVLNPRAAILHFIAENPHSHPSPSFQQSRNFHHFSSSGRDCRISGISFSGNLWYSKSHTASFCSVPEAADGDKIDTVKELHDKIIESVKVTRSCPPNAWLWSMMKKCKGPDDIKLLFDALEQLRTFRLSNLRVYKNYKMSICLEVTRTCIRSSALDFGKKTLRKHNVYGLTPTERTAINLLAHAKKRKDVKLMEDILRLMKKNDIPLQSYTADMVCRVCYAANNWVLICKYAKRFMKGGVKLRKTTFETWLGFASRRGDVGSLWEIEKLRSELYDRHHTISSAFSCCKGFLLESKPNDAAAILQEITQKYHESKQKDILAELDKLVNEWPVEVIKAQKNIGRAALITKTLKDTIPAMIDSLSKMGVNSSVNLDKLNTL